MTNSQDPDSSEAVLKTLIIHSQNHPLLKIKLKDAFGIVEDQERQRELEKIHREYFSSKPSSQNSKRPR